MLADFGGEEFLVSSESRLLAREGVADDDRIRLTLIHGQDVPFDLVTGQRLINDWQELELRLNGQPLERFSGNTSRTTKIIEFPARLLTVAPSTLALHRVAGTPGVPVVLQSWSATRLPRGESDDDGDGLPLYWEIENGLDPATADSSQDDDHDGLDTLGEFLHNTDLYRRDSDGDTLSDGLEVSLALNPLSKDSDLDGFDDDEEWRQGSDPSDDSSRPAAAHFPQFTGEDFNQNGLPDPWELWSGQSGLQPGDDDDGDGFDNAAEAVAGTSPLDANSYPALTLLRNEEGFRAQSIRLPFKSLRINSSSDLESWFIGPWESGTTTRNLVGAHQFAQLEVTDLDSDGDGLTDWSESLLGSDRFWSDSRSRAVAYDSNGDGITDNQISGDLAAALVALEQDLSSLSPSAAARFLTRATFGPTPASVNHLRALGIDDWFAEQAATPPTLLSPYAQSAINDYYTEEAGRYYYRVDFENFLPANNFGTPFYRAAIAGPDQLRQRMAFALSQIMVASRNDPVLAFHFLGITDYYDVLVENSQGNFYDLLRAVTWHPCMGQYLSHLGNTAAREGENRHPDENYAREVMQLFTIGLWELHPDGSRKTTPEGALIPTYQNSDITELARAFTGHWFQGQAWGYGGWQDEHFSQPMRMDETRHDFGEKTFLGRTLAARAPTAAGARRDVDAALRVLFEHPNTPIFVSQALIQFLVTSNPSPEYIQRVQDIFVDDGKGERGNLLAVAQAILTDSEALSPASALLNPRFGKMKELVLRATQLARLGGLEDKTDFHFWNPTPGSFVSATLQEPMLSPSVFNFYRPDHRPNGLLAQEDMLAPVFQITDSFTSIATPVKLWEIVERGFWQYGHYQSPLDWSREVELAADSDLLLDHLDRYFCSGQLSSNSRTLIPNAVEQIPATDRLTRTRLALQLVIASPDAAIQR